MLRMFLGVAGCCRLVAERYDAGTSATALSLMMPRKQVYATTLLLPGQDNGGGHCDTYNCQCL